MKKPIQESTTRQVSVTGAVLKQTMMQRIFEVTLPGYDAADDATDDATDDLILWVQASCAEDVAQCVPDDSLITPLELKFTRPETHPGIDFHLPLGAGALAARCVDLMRQHQPPLERAYDVLNQFEYSREGGIKRYPPAEKYEAAMNMIKDLIAKKPQG
jgi:hypothetical protein